MGDFNKVKRKGLLQNVPGIANVCPRRKVIWIAKDKSNFQLECHHNIRVKHRGQKHIRCWYCASPSDKALWLPKYADPYEGGSLYG